MSIETTIPLADVLGYPIYHKVVLEELKGKGELYYGHGRLNIGWLQYYISRLITKWYVKKREFLIQAHLVIPPDLILTAMSIFREDEWTKNFATRLVEKVWIDTHIEAKPPNCPWYLFASPDLIVGDEIDLEGMYYSAGTAP